jgi:hypothetical protein
MSKEKPTVIIIHETRADSWRKDAGSVIAAAALIGVGVICDSAAMQWAGFWLFAIGFFSWAISAKGDHNKTPQEAANFLRDRFNVRAEG